MRYAIAGVITCATLLASLGATQGQEASMEGDAMSSPGIDAQKQEIEELTSWLEEQAQ